MYRIFYIALLASFALSSSSVSADFFECGYDSESPPLILYDIPDTIMGVAIYCCWEEADSTNLPFWAYTMWDSSTHESVPSYYEDVTDEIVLFFADVVGRDSNTCIISDIDPDSGAAPIYAYVIDVLTRADSLINFADYDNDGPNGIPASQDTADGTGDDDGYVDAVYFIDMWYLNACGSAGIWDYTTNDTSITGDTILVGDGNGVRVRAISELGGLTVLVHELGHRIELIDLYPRWTDRPDTLEHRALGSYEIMSNVGFSWVPSPFTPFSKSLLGISDIINVEEPMYDVTFSDYERSDTCYKLPTVNADEYFLISAYDKSDSSSYWIDQWPRPNNGGILITHIRTDFSNRDEYWNKKTDIESAHGLWNVDWPDPPGPPEFTTPNATTGRDSMDFGGVYMTHPRWSDIGNRTCLYDGVSYTAFDGLSNPNSNLYSVGDSFPQNIPSHVAVRNIQVQGNGVFLADFLVNNWYDTLETSTIWGDSTEHTAYAITGDIVVKAGDTLTIEKGTTIYFQELEDNQAGGADANRSELIVYGTLVAIGTSTDSILFVPSSEQLSTAEAGDWFGIRFMPGADSMSIMEYCAVRYAEYGLYMDSSTVVSVKNCNVSRNDHSGIYVRAGDLSLEDSKVTYNDYGVYLIDDGVADIEDSELSSNAATGVWNRPGKLNMNHCTLTNNGVMGIRGWRSIDSVYNTTISGKKYGIYWEGESEAVFDSCVITWTGQSGSYYGIYARKSGSSNPDVYVLNDSISDFPQGGIYFKEISEDGCITNTDVVSCGTYGAYYENSSALISGGQNTKNLFYGNTYGLYLYSSSSPEVRRSHFKNNFSRGVKIRSGCFPDFGVAADSGLNSFTANIFPTIDLDNGDNLTQVYAIGNWWGENPPTKSEIINAIYKPYLTSDPLPARIVPDWETESLPQDFTLAKIFPNPFNPTTAIRFNLASPQDVTVKIYNILGQEVVTLVDGRMPAGQSTLIWDGRDRSGDYVSSGIYLCQLRTEEGQRTLKMTVLR